MNKLNVIILHATFVLTSITGLAQMHKQTTDVLPLDKTVRTGKLTNGFTYFIKHNEEPKNRVVFYLANKVGSILEDEDQRGLAHFMEHMSFNGTQHFPKNALVDYLQKSGVRFGADINAYTNFDETVYQLPLPSDDPAIINNGLEIIYDWTHAATLDPVEIDKERGVVLEEKRLGKGAGERMQNKYFPVLLNNSRYSQRLPIGTDDVLNNFKLAAIQRYYHDWYRPDLQAIIVVGDIDVDQMEKTIRTKFSDLKNPTNEKPRVKYKVPLTGRNQFIAVTDPEMTATNLEVIIKQPQAIVQTAADYRASMLRALYNTMLNDRYNELLLTAEPPFLSGGAGINGFMGGLDAYNMVVTAKPNELEKGFKAAWRETERATRFGFSATELTRAKTSYQNQVEAVLKEKDKTSSSSYVKEYLQYFLYNVPSPGIDMEEKLTSTYLPGITLNEINALAKTAVKNINRDILIEAPEKDKNSLPSETTMNGWIREIQHENLKPYQDDTSKASLLATEPVEGKIISESKDVRVGIVTLTLSNGIKVLLKPTNYKNDEISFNGFSAGGTSLYNDKDFQSAVAANYIQAFGAGNYNTTELNKMLSGKQLNVQVSIGEREQSVSGEAGNDDMGLALKLMYAYLMEPRKDPGLFQSMMSRSKASLANRQNDPVSIYQDTVSAVLGDHNPRRTGPSIDKLNQIDLDKAYKIFKERFADETGFTFVFVGSIDTSILKPFIRKYIASLPCSGKVQQANDLHIHTPPGIIERTVRKGSEPKSTVNLVFTGSYDYSFENNVKMDALKETLQIRMIERLREDEGGVYSPGVQIKTTKLPQSRFSMTITFGCAPQNVDKLVASALDELNKVKKDGPLQVNLDKFRAENHRSMETSLKNNDFWLAYLGGQLRSNEDLDQIFNYDKILQAMTPNDVKTVAEKYLTGKNYIKLVLSPEK